MDQFLLPRTVSEAGSGSCGCLRDGSGTGDQLGGERQTRMVPCYLCHAKSPNSAPPEAAEAKMDKPEGFLPEQADTAAMY